MTLDRAVFEVSANGGLDPDWSLLGGDDCSLLIKMIDDREYPSCYARSTEKFGIPMQLNMSSLPVLVLLRGLVGEASRVAVSSIGELIKYISNPSTPVSDVCLCITPG